MAIGQSHWIGHFLSILHPFCFHSSTPRDNWNHDTTKTHKSLLVSGDSILHLILTDKNPIKCKRERKSFSWFSKLRKHVSNEFHIMRFYCLIFHYFIGLNALLFCSHWRKKCGDEMESKGIPLHTFIRSTPAWILSIKVCVILVRRFSSPLHLFFREKNVINVWSVSFEFEFCSSPTSRRQRRLHHHFCKCYVKIVCQ